MAWKLNHIQSIINFEEIIRLQTSTFWVSPGVGGHVLRQVGEKHGHVEADGLAGLVVGLLERRVVDLPLVVLFSAAQQELYLLAGEGK